MTNKHTEPEKSTPDKTADQEFREILNQSIEQFTGPVRSWGKQLLMGWGAVSAAAFGGLTASMAVNASATPTAILLAATAAAIFGAATAYGTAFSLWNLRQSVQGRPGRRKCGSEEENR